MFLFIGVIFLVVSCKSIDVNKFLYRINEITGEDYQALKTNTKMGDGWFVFQNGYRTYYTDADGNLVSQWVGKGQYWALNLNSPNRSNYAYDDDFFNAESIPVFGIPWTNNYRDANGNIFETDSVSNKDLEKIGNFTDKIKKEKISEELIANYGLSVERSAEVANLLSDYTRITQKRSLTEKEQDYFSKKVLGVGFKDADSVIKGGNTEDLGNLIQKAAELNGTTPEQMQEIFVNIIGN